MRRLGNEQHSSDLAGHQRACPNVACGAGFAGADCQVSPDGRFISQTPRKRVFVRKMDRPSLRFKTKSRLCGVWEMNSTSSDLAGHQRACPDVACGAGFAGADCQVSSDGRYITQTPHKRVFVKKMDRQSLRFKTKSRLCGVWEMNSTPATSRGISGPALMWPVAQASRGQIARSRRTVGSFLKRRANEFS